VAISKEVKVGLLALVAGTILYIGFNFLKGIDFFSPTKSYYVVYDNIDGLSVSNPVLVNGWTVGRVHSIKILQNRGNRLLVRIEVNNDIIVGDSSVAVLSSPSLLEGKAIVLRLNKFKTYLQENDTLLSDKEKSLTELISAKAAPALNDLDTTLLKINRILVQIETEQRIRGILRNVEEITKNLNNMTVRGGKIDQLTNNLNDLTLSLNATQKNINPVLENMNTFSSSLNKMQIGQTVNSANESLNKMNRLLTGIEKGEGSLGKFVKDDSLYLNLNKTAVDLDKLFIDMQKRPKRYVQFSVFGKRDK
jgi:phospholipid/cholesterol/gamma-HCH transport system substrate-binding protein